MALLESGNPTLSQKIFSRSASEISGETMNTDVLKGKWKQVSGDVKKSFAKLTDDDLLYAEGNQEKIIGKLQERYGYSRDEAQREWNKFTTQHRDFFE